MKIVTIDTIVQGLSIENDIELTDEFCIIDNIIYNDITTDNAIVYDVSDDKKPKYYYNDCYIYGGVNFYMPPENEPKIVRYHKSYLKSFTNDFFENKKSYGAYLSDDTFIDTDNKLYNFVCSIISQAKNHPLTFNYILFDGSNSITYTSADIIKLNNGIENHYQACDNKYEEVVQLIEDCSTLDEFDNLDLDSYLPKENQRLNLDGTINTIIPNLFSLDITIDKKSIVANGEDNVTATIKLLYNGNLSSYSDGDMWYIPILGIDGNQADLISFAFENGEGTIIWNTSKRGIYTIRMDLIRPKPKATISGNLEIIAT